MNKLIRLVVTCVVLAVVSLNLPRASAQCFDTGTLLPTNGAIVVVQFAGDQLGAAYQKSALGQVIQDEAMQKFLDKPCQFIRQQLATAAQNGVDTKPIEDLLALLGRHDAALTVSMPGVGAPNVFAVVSLGKDAAEAERLVQVLLKHDTAAQSRKVKDTTVTTFAGMGQVSVAGGFLFIGNNGPAIEQAIEKVTAPGFAGFGSRAASSLGQTPIGSIRVDLPAVRAAVRTAAPPDVAGKVDAVAKALGLEKADRFEMVAAFDGSAIRLRARLESPKPFAGLLAVLGNGAPLDEKMLKLLPAEAVTASITRLNVGLLWDTIMGAIQASVGPGGYAEFEKEKAKAEEELGIKIKEDLIDQLGDTFVMFAQPASNPLGSDLAIMVAAKDSQKLAATVEKLIARANAELGKSAGDGLALKIAKSDAGGVTVYSLAGVPMFMPSVAIKGDYLVVALSAGSMNVALARLGDAKTSILDNQDFQSVRKMLPSEVIGLSYEDTRQGVAKLYETLNTIGPMLAGAKDAPIDLLLLPPLATVQAKLFGTIAVTTVDDKGISGHMYSPFGINIGSAIGSFGGGGAWALPAMAASRSAARAQAQIAFDDPHRDKCQQRLQHIGQACRRYASLHGGRYPAKMEDITDLVAAADRKCAATDAADSFVFVAGATTDDKNKVLVYDADGNHPDGHNVLLRDGTVKWMSEAELRQALKSK